MRLDRSMLSRTTTITRRVVSCVLTHAFVAGILVGSRPPGFAGEPGSTKWVAELNRLAQYLGRSVSAKELAAIEATRTAERPETQALRAALLYRADPVKWASELSSTYSIHDYAARARGETNDITQEEFVSRIKQLESQHPSLEPGLVLLVAFIQFRDANIWFPQGDQKLSAARFFRGAFLAQVLKGSRLNAESVANQLDQEARREFELGRKGMR